MEKLLRDEEWSKWSDREIARRCGVNNSTVSRIRHDLSVGMQQIERKAERNGTIYTINTANIGGTNGRDEAEDFFKIKTPIEFDQQKKGQQEIPPYKTISACSVYEKLCTAVHILPVAEKQVRPLTTLKSDEEQIEAWNMAVESAKGIPTEEDVKTAVKTIKEKKRQQEIAKPVCQVESNPEPEPEPEQDYPTEDKDDAFQLESEEQVIEEPQAPPPALELKVQIDGPAPAFITLDEWKRLDDERTAYYLSGIPSNKAFNRQDNESIEWAQWSWNPVTGCRHDCPYCYARDIANRYYPQKFEPSFIPDKLVAPRNTKVPQIAKEDPSYKNVFVCSMADLFGRWVPAEWIEAILEQVRSAPQWDFLFLTKFPKRMAEFNFPRNAWLGTSVDCQARVKNAERAFERLQGGTKWLSVEPLLEPLKFDRLDLFDWIVIGGASASTQTPEWVPPIDWISDLHQQARAAGCRIYYKHNCGMQESLRIKEFPWAEPKRKELPDVFRYLAKASSKDQTAEGSP